MSFGKIISATENRRRIAWRALCRIEYFCNHYLTRNVAH